MDKETATRFIERIEAHRAEEDAIWDEMRRRDDYEMHEDKTVKAIIDARKKARDLLEEAEADLDAFDWVDDGTGDYVPRDEAPAWPDVSAELRAELRDNKKALQMLDHIDRLHAHAMEKGLPVITKGALEAELAKS